FGDEGGEVFERLSVPVGTDGAKGVREPCGHLNRLGHEKMSRDLEPPPHCTGPANLVGRQNFQSDGGFGSTAPPPLSKHKGPPG
ncbi:unnamed protein product, partial [Allacma fusca]